MKLYQPVRTGSPAWPSDRKASDGHGRGHPLLRRWALAYAFLVPALAIAAVFSYYPAGSALFHSLFNWSNYSRPKFVGLSNFSAMPRDPVLVASAQHIGLYALFWVAMDLTVPLLAARLIAGVRSVRLQGLFRFVFMLQLVFPIVVIAELWSFFFDPNIGLINKALEAVGFTNLTQPWLGDPHTALFAMMFMWAPWVDALAFLIYVAGIQGIAPEVMDAAAIDGASAVSAFFRIEVPLLFGQIRLVLVIAVAGVLTSFTTFLLMTDGGPGNATEVPGLVIFQDAFLQGQYGYASAIAVAVFAVTLGLTVVLMRLLRPRTN